MKMFRILGRNIKDAFKSVFRNFSLSMASISCTAVTLILVAIAILVTYNVNSVTRDFEEVLTIVVFVDKEATSEEIDNLTYQINSIGNVDETKTIYNSKDKLKEELSKDEKMKKVLDTLKENPLQSSFVISVKNVKKITPTAEEIKALPKVTSVRYGATLVDKVINTFDIVRTGCIVAVIALIIVTAFLIANTIKITIFSRRQEINIMRLVGTSNIVIKMPFLFEGLILGVIGAVIPILLTIYGYMFLYDYLGGTLMANIISLVEPKQIVYEASIVLLIVGGVVGMFGSLRAVKRYLKI